MLKGKVNGVNSVGLSFYQFLGECPMDSKVGNAPQY